MAIPQFDRHHGRDYSRGMAKSGAKRAEKAKKGDEVRFKLTSEQFSEVEDAARLDGFDEDVNGWARRAILLEARRVRAAVSKP